MLPLRFVQFLVRRCTRQNLWCSHRPPLHTERRQVWSTTHFVWIIFLFKNIDLTGGQINDEPSFLPEQGESQECFMPGLMH